jgi:hypothetical protein
MPKKISSLLLPAVFLSLLALLAGLWAGLLRLGWTLPGAQSALPALHGPLMVSGFLGSLIAVERAVALRQRWMFAAPILAGLGWVAGLAAPGSQAGPLLITLGSAGTVAILVVMVWREPELHTITIGIGTICWLTGNLLWLSGEAIFQIVFWWAAFLVLTITGERLELSRVLRGSRIRSGLFLLAGGVLLVGVIMTRANIQLGERMAGVGLLALALWLLWFDIARRNLRHPAPLTRYIARCLYAGYFWLGFSGALSLWLGPVFAGPYYDAVLHSLFVGFAISMIFGHAPIILPALLGRMLPYHPGFLLSLILLHASLVMRIAGDLGGSVLLRQWGGLLNEVSILLFLAFMVMDVRAQMTEPKRRREIAQ